MMGDPVSPKSQLVIDRYCDATASSPSCQPNGPNGPNGSSVERMVLTTEGAVLLLIDLQQRLMPVIH